MTSRPTDWAPLAERDPLPGDPDAIFGEASRLRNMAVGIRDQAGRLRRIGADASMAGQSVEELRASALEAAKRLETVAERYSKVSGLLNSWAPELEEFQAATVKTLNKALAAEAERKRNPHSDLLNPNLFTYQTMPPGGLGAAPELTGPEAQLAEARRDLRHVLDEAAGRDRYWAHQISQAIDDNLTDGFFDHIHQWVERNNGWIEGLTDKLGWVTTIAAVAALLVPGLGEGVVLVELVEVAEGVGQASAGISLAAHAVQVAGGEKGAGFDLGLDIFALGGLSAAKGLTRGLGRTAEATRDAAAEAAKRAAADRIRRSTEEEFARVMADPSATQIAKRTAIRDWEDVDALADRAGSDAEAVVHDAPEAEAGLRSVMLAGDREAANSLADINAMRAQYGDDATVAQLAERGDRLATAGRANFLTATVVDLTDKAGNHTALKHSYGGFQDWVVTGGPLR